MDAIQQDVDNEVVTEETPQDAPQQMSRQQEELERIAEKVGEDHETEGSFRDEDEPSTEELSNPLRNEDGIYYATAKVNGEEVDVPWDEVLAQYQKNSAADKRLQEAAERQRELEEYEAKLNAYRSDLEARTRQPSPDVGTPTESLSSDATDALYAQYHDALFQGDEEKASNLLKQIRSAEKPEPQIDVTTIIERTKAEMREEERQARERGYENRRQDAVKMFHEEYPDISGDASLLAVADRRSAELYKENPTRDPWDIMQECGNFARDWLKSYVEKVGGESKDVSRQERKQNMDEVVPKTVRASIGEDEVEMTYSDIISEMRQGRNQPA
tara:strand:- start:772 stop:1761 length:990 start_codon:yes stop_codon:yes gene_type:complete